MLAVLLVLGLLKLHKLCIKDILYVLCGQVYYYLFVLCVKTTIIFVDSME